MKKLGLALIVIGALAGCEKKTPPPPPPAGAKADVEVQAPGVDVKAGEGKVEVKAPGADVEVQK